MPPPLIPWLIFKGPFRSGEGEGGKRKEEKGNGKGGEEQGLGGRGKVREVGAGLAIRPYVQPAS